ncbi:uncharacterized protein ARMOST_02286 [Armillaria ostoyae]|uniref:Uncharacterized protein n=1 Tax=Armillaria ostoyae TaxID=47428 RepID=A0A284QRB7_ARMOS|nr:uncharacterized protein ARMOST_02286 [Armillaria ostoyae]
MCFTFPSHVFGASHLHGTLGTNLAPPTTLYREKGT